MFLALSPTFGSMLSGESASLSLCPLPPTHAFPLSLSQMIFKKKKKGTGPDTFPCDFY